MNRIAKWDNLKYMLITLVVIGHTMHYFVGYGNQVDMAKAIYLFIYSFHMPAFIFVAGVFAKSAIEKKRYESIIEMLLIYVVMKFLENVGRFLSGSDLNFHFLWASGPEWFALAIAVFIAATMFLKNYNWKYVLGIAVLVGCLAGLDTHFGDHFASMRICVFYPVFLAGYYTKVDVFDTLKGRGILAGGKGVAIKLGAAAVLVGTLILCVLKIDVLYPMIHFVKGNREFAEMNMGIEGVVLRLGCYVFWAIMVFAIAVLAPERQLLITWLGQRTMATFIWHTLVLMIIFAVLNGTFVLISAVPALYILIAICVACIVSIICAYLPELRVSKKLRIREDKTIEEI